MFNCGDCWDNPCRCGTDYEHLSVKALTDLAVNLKTIRDRKLLAEDVTAEDTHGAEPSVIRYKYINGKMLTLKLKPDVGRRFKPSRNTTQSVTYAVTNEGQLSVAQEGDIIGTLSMYAITGDTLDDFVVGGTFTPQEAWRHTYQEPIVLFKQIPVSVYRPV